jgi:adenosylcobyric acid synthase
MKGKRGETAELGLLPLTTRMMTGNQLRDVNGMMVDESALVVWYEIHNGVSERSALSSPLLYIEGQPKDAISDDGQIMGAYLYGLVHRPDACQALLKRLGLTNGERNDYQAQRETDRLADMLEVCIDIDVVIALIEAGVWPSR